MSSHYYLIRDEDDSERLVKQHDIWIKSLGYYIHPFIKKTLPKTDVRIADIGCGTGIWLIDLALTADDPSWRFDGFDIAQDQFPHRSHSSAAATAEATKEARKLASASNGTLTEALGSSVLPENVELHMHDTREPYPEEYHGKFDLVHARLMLVSLDPHEWDKVVSNLRVLLKPGGWIQWEELDYTPFLTTLRSQELPPDSECVFLPKAINHVIKIIQPRAENVHLKLLNACRESGLQDIGTDVVSSDRIPSLRSEGTRRITQVIKSLCRRQLDDGVKGAWSEEELNRVTEGMEEETTMGWYINFYMHCVFGKA